MTVPSDAYGATDGLRRVELEAIPSRLRHAGGIHHRKSRLSSDSSEAGGRSRKAGSQGLGYARSRKSSERRANANAQ